MNADQLITEARAKIVWGEDPASVLQFLVSNGMQQSEAEAFVHELDAERRQEIRRLGWKNLVIGAVILVGAGILIAVLAKHFTASSSRRTVRTISVLVFAGLYGLWKFAQGLVNVIRPQAGEQSSTDLLD